MKIWSMLLVVLASLASASCFLFTHDPALQRGVVTTTTSADLAVDAGVNGDSDAGAARHPRPNASELNDVTRDSQ